MFPFLSDGGFQTQRYNTYSYLELFNSKFKDECPAVRTKAYRPMGIKGRAQPSPYEYVFRQYISQKTQDVSIGCYLGRECSIGDYSRFSLYSMQHRIAHVYPLEAIANVPYTPDTASNNEKDKINLRRLHYS